MYVDSANKLLRLGFIALLFESIIIGLAQADDRSENSNAENLCVAEGGDRGVCISISNQIKYCPNLYQILKNRNFTKLRESVCASDYTRVCCAIKEFQEVPPQGNEPNLANHENFKLFSLKECGTSVTSDRIFGGNKSNPGEFPFMARIGVKPILDNVEGPSQFICGGSLINKRYVLTAAHCFKNEHHKVSEIVLGQTDEHLAEECLHETDRDGNKFDIACEKPIRVGIEEVIVHDGYNKEVGSLHDVALIRLDQDIKFSIFVSPVCLPFLKEYDLEFHLSDTKLLQEDGAIVAGWGKTNNAEILGSPTLQFVKVPIQPHILCRISYGSFHVAPTQLCAGGVKGQDSCLGDSGGPLYVPATPGKAASSRALRLFQIGVVSYGKTKCGRGNEPVVYSRLRSYLHWILDNIRP